MRTTTTAQAKARKPAPAEMRSPSRDELIRMLLEQSQTTGCHAQPITPAEEPGAPPPEEVILDVDLEGSRYLLVRLPQSSKVQLSPREQEIVRMVSQGHPNKVIADVLNISSWTVCTHLRRIFAKLGVGSRAAMVAKAHNGMPVASAPTATRRMAAGS
jgi:DNA-binding CsgD family transcriptional regulator